MRTPLRSALHRCRRSPGLLPVLVMLAGSVAGCTDNPNVGVDPPADKLFFPAGVILDPRGLGDGADRLDDPVRHLIVTNGNNDLSFNAGTVMAVDLDAFFDAWYDDELGVYPYCEDAPTGDRSRRRCVLDAGSATTEELPCRRLGLKPSVVECEESVFVSDSVRVGDFATVIAASHRAPDGVPRLWVPVRGDPSITYIEVRDGPDGTPDLACGQDREGGEFVDDSRCSDTHRLTHLRNDGSLAALAREPFNIIVDETDDYRYAYVAHSAGGMLTLIDLDGLRGGGRPAIVDAQPVFSPAVGGAAGGFGLAARPCEPERDNVPSVTLGCDRPLVYGSMRFNLFLTSFTIGEIEAEDLPEDITATDECFDASGELRGPFCARPEDIGKPCAIICEPAVEASRQVEVGGVDPFSNVAVTALGDIEFADEHGEELWIVQTTPGALLPFDTSLDFDNEPIDVPAGPPIELCDRPTRMEIWRAKGLAFVSCFQAALIYVVDLRAHRVISIIVAGTGPHDLELDAGRKKLYVTNILERSISVLELDDRKPTYLEEIARIGLQEQFEQ